MKADSVEVVECRKRRTTKIFASIGVLLFAVPLVGVIAVQLLRPGLIPAYATIAILCAFFLVVLLWVVTFVYPDVSASNQGMWVKLPFTRVFVPWDQIVAVREYPRSTQVIVKRLTLLNYPIGLFTLPPRPAFLIEQNRTHYPHLRALIQASIEERFTRI